MTRMASMNSPATSETPGPAVFVVAASSLLAQRNATRAVVKGIEPSRVDGILKALGSEQPPRNSAGYVSVWAINSSLRNYWQRMRPSDWVLFYQRGFISIAARVAYTVESRELASAIWGPGQADSLRLSLILQEVTHTWAPAWALREELGGRFLGFRPLGKDRLGHIRVTYGSIDAFVTMTVLSHRPPPKMRRS
jgi:hypothetical protein